MIGRDQKAARRFLAVVQDARGYPPPGLAERDQREAGGMKVMWNTGAADATGEVVSADPNFGDAVVRRDPGPHNGGVEYRLPLSALWAITDPPYQRRAILDRECAPHQFVHTPEDGVLCATCGKEGTDDDLA